MTKRVRKFMKEYEQKLAGSYIYIVGGAVRDKLMGRVPNDFDFATDAKLEDIEKHFKCVNIGQSKDFGITSIQYEGESFEVAEFRSDGTYTNNRHPDAVKFGGGISEDAERRDFTINAMYIDSEGDTWDFFDGEIHIKEKRIVAVGNPDERIKEDALRILRALRFSVTYDFSIAKSLKTAIVDNRESIKNLSQERITGEIIKVASKGGKVFYKYFELLEEFKLMPIVFPEIEVMKGFGQHYIHHPEGGTMKDVKTNVISPLNIKAIEKGSHTVESCGTVYDHILAVMSRVPANACELTVLSALYHDVAKPMTAVLKDDETGTSSFKRHEYKGVALFDEIAKKRKIGGELRECIKFCIAQHMNMNNKDLSKKSKILELALNPYFDILAEVSRADDGSRNVAGNRIYKKKDFDRNLQRFLDARVTYVDTTVFKAKVALLINGKKVMDLCDLKPCKKVGTIIELTTEAIVESDFTMTQDAIDTMIVSFGKCDFKED